MIIALLPNHVLYIFLCYVRQKLLNYNLYNFHFSKRNSAHKSFSHRSLTSRHIAFHCWKSCFHTRQSKKGNENCWDSVKHFTEFKLSGLETWNHFLFIFSAFCLQLSQPWDFFGRNDAKAETLVVWPPDANSWLIGKDFDAGRDWGQEKKGTTEDEMTGLHHWLNGRESEWTLGVGDGQGGLACCDSWGQKESDTTEWLNWTDKEREGNNYLPIFFTIKTGF